MSDEREMGTDEESAQAWREGIQKLRMRLTEETQEHPDKVDDLIRLRGNLSFFIEPIESSLLGYDPDDPGPEGVFG